MRISAGINTALKKLEAIGMMLRSIRAKLVGFGFTSVAALLGTAKMFSGTSKAADSAIPRRSLSVEAIRELGHPAELSTTKMETLSPLATAVDPVAAADELLMREAPQARKRVADYLANEVEVTLEEWMKIGVIVKGTPAQLRARELAARLRRAGTWEYSDSELADLPAKVKGFLSLDIHGNAA